MIFNTLAFNTQGMVLKMRPYLWGHNVIFLAAYTEVATFLKLRLIYILLMNFAVYAAQPSNLQYNQSRLRKKYALIIELTFYIWQMIYLTLYTLKKL